MAALKAVLFDCDGTIADSAGLICDIMERCFLVHGLEPPAREATRSIIGLSLNTAIAALRPSLTAFEVARLADAYRSEYRLERSRPHFAEHLFEGMVELVLDLAARENVFVGMVTGKSRRGVAALTASHGLTGAFSVVRTADDCPSKPHPAMVLESCGELGLKPASAVVVGDTSFDMEMARAAGSTAIGVSWGSHAPEHLMRSGSLQVTETVQDLSAALDRWLAREPART
ncbi:Haloacid dehalogenase-like hydrolase:HAD-superfamily hydrolase, subfamily IA, variant 3:HAD-superfamily hydrolase [Fulvimarina pelagi HTCC2506]|uniref:Haloacid dehalogenase-like hydrolase:HAD-superfamily hydrolase, subfamily IA, variant 3:HAD-superfamily hydrolase n=1 Tax=Fulvimarina pelagi HTCC2506 TaxID=314231 RepID=Q0G6Y3_9HYPH|nr:HAD-IA family hydrolase [Fulvimarina pelagi]EAU42581.1 Haloacid dehalogenase-like hydrolase:HAD-superfamily hydrolase, subfamily IA, variant 3:HAD-superfamily hydrolase [Fulvimarina pelagi HTCC2506]